MQHLTESPLLSFACLPPLTTDVGAAAAAVGNGWEIQSH